MIPTIKTNSRDVVAGDTYVALKGVHTDGHSYIQEARERGALRSIIEDPLYQVSDTVLVGSTYDWYRHQGYLHRKQYSIPVILIAGSNGKTTTKELLTACLQKKYKVVSSHKNENNEVGVPKTLLGIDEQTEIAVIEVGANHSGEHYKLTLATLPTHVYMTNHGKDHMQGYNDAQGGRSANIEVFDALRYTSGIVFVESLDCPIAYDAWGVEQVPLDDGITIQESVYGTIVVQGEVVTSQLYGAFNGANMKAAYSIATYFGVSHEDCVSALRSYCPTLLRSQVLLYENKSIVADCYNANPTSMLALLKHQVMLNEAPVGLILGGMKELGVFGDDEHRAIVAYVYNNRARFSHCLFVGAEWSTIEETRQNGCQYYPTVEHVIEADVCTSLFAPVAKILIKGSRSIALEKIIETYYGQS